MRTPFEQQTTYAPQSIAGTPEAQAFLDVPIDVDPGVARRTDLAEQEAENRANSVFSGGVPQFFREWALAGEKRGIRAQGAYEEREAQAQKNRLNLERRRLLLPQIAPTGQSGYGTQIVQPQPGFLQNLAVGVASGLAGNPKI